MIFPLFLIPIITGLTAQGLKPFLNKRHYSALKVAGLKVPRYGGMPSAHTAFAISLATTTAVVDGFFSTTFAIAITILFYTIDDALRMRMFLSRHGDSLRKLIKRLPTDDQTKYPYIESRLGHSLPEVIGGAILGLIWSLLLLWLYFSVS